MATATESECTAFLIGGQLVNAWGHPVDEAELPSASVGYIASKVDALKAELKKRQEAGREFDTASIKSKADLVAALEADDIAQLQE